jgi:hypothetical protein
MANQALGRRGTVAKHSFVERVLGVLSLREEMFKEIARDTTANQQAIRALVLGSIGPALGSMFLLGLVALPFFFILGMIIWCFYGALIYFLATKAFAAEDTEANLGAFCRAIAFAGLPRFVQFGTFSPALTLVFGAVGVAWTFAATVIAVRSALNLNTSRAAGAAFIGAAVQTIATAMILGG